MWTITTTACLVILVSAVIDVDAAAVPTNFGCRNSLISDEWRATVLNFHNDKRRLLATGQQLNKDGTALKAAGKMNELAWDCNLEHQATEGAAKCGSFTLANKGVNQKLFKSSGTCDIKSKTKEVLNEWWNEVRTVGLAADRKFAVGLENFANMAFWNTANFACSYANCPGGTQLLCIYDKLGAKTDKVLYAQVADATKACSTCPATSPCEYWLCQPPFTLSAESPLLCKHDGMTNDMTQTAVEMHNYYRRLLATGWAEDKVSVYAPTAKQMLPLTTSCANKQSLAYDAAQKAAECASPPSAPSSPAYSQNYLRIDDYKIDRLDALKQMAFDQTSALGCGVETCTKQGFTMVVCEYDKKILEEEKIYETGKVCTGCATKKCEALGGLCAL